MKLENGFVVPSSVAESWDLLGDFERVARCVPGAEITKVEGDTCHGIITVKLGPIVARYEGTATFVERDESSHVAVIRAEGRDPRQGAADALIRAGLEAGEEGSTVVNLDTDLNLSGKFAGFAAGAVQDVARNVLDQFSDRLEQQLAIQTSPDGDESSDRESPESDHLDLGAIAGSVLRQRVIPVVAVIVAIVVIIWILTRGD